MDNNIKKNGLGHEQQDTTGSVILDNMIDSEMFKGLIRILSYPFSFDRYIIWGFMKILHFLVQTVGFIKFLDYAKSSYLITPDTNVFLVWICYFLVVRTIFEFIGVIFSINGKLQDISENLKKLDMK